MNIKSRIGHGRGARSVRDTSMKAGEDIRRPAPGLREIVLTQIRISGMFGITCDEIEQQLGMKHQTVSARIRELVQKDKIEDTGMRRKTRSGSKAIVWTSK